MGNNLFYWSGLKKVFRNERNAKMSLQDAIFITDSISCCMLAVRKPKKDVCGVDVNCFPKVHKFRV